MRTLALHGDKSQDERLKALTAFRAGELDLLVATDVAARGLDITDLPAVFNFDVPFHPETACLEGADVSVTRHARSHRTSGSAGC